MFEIPGLILVNQKKKEKKCKLYMIGLSVIESRNLYYQFIFLVLHFEIQNKILYFTIS